MQPVKVDWGWGKQEQIFYWQRVEVIKSTLRLNEREKLKEKIVHGGGLN